MVTSPFHGWHVKHSCQYRPGKAQWEGRRGRGCEATRTLERPGERARLGRCFPRPRGKHRAHENASGLPVLSRVPGSMALPGDSFVCPHSIAIVSPELPAVRLTDGCGRRMGASEWKRNPGDLPPVTWAERCGKAAEGRRTPRRFAPSGARDPRASVLDCCGPPQICLPATEAAIEARIAPRRLITLCESHPPGRRPALRTLTGAADGGKLGAFTNF
jgi:hypothetical protein